MLKQIIKPAENFILAISGGVDSMAIYDFYKTGKKNFTPVFFHHKTKTSEKAEQFLRKTVGDSLVVGYLEEECPKGESKEQFWRKHRYAFLRSFGKEIVTAHHLDDVVETWIFSCLRGNPKIIPVQNQGVVRPFLTNRKSEFKKWCENKKVSWIEDESNSDDKYMRNFIRNNMVKDALVVNPGLHKVISKKVMESLTQ